MYAIALFIKTPHHELKMKRTIEKKEALETIF